MFRLGARRGGGVCRAVNVNYGWFEVDRDAAADPLAEGHLYQRFLRGACGLAGQGRAGAVANSYRSPQGRLARRVRCLAEARSVDETPFSQLSAPQLSLDPVGLGHRLSNRRRKANARRDDALGESFSLSRHADRREPRLGFLLTFG
jgi:hypothetical protein